jgi:hypothetical protein
LSGAQYEELVLGAYNMRRGHNEKLDKIIHSKDLDGDGVISYEEFVDALQHNQVLQFPGVFGIVSLCSVIFTAHFLKFSVYYHCCVCGEWCHCSAINLLSFS